MTISQWSTTVADNDDASTGVNWLEGQLARTVNNSSRQMMTDVAYWRDAMSGRLVSAGTADAQTLTTGLSLASYATMTLLAFEAGSALTNTGACTLNVDAIGAKSIKNQDGTDPKAGDITAGGIHLISYEAGADNIILLTRANTGNANAGTAGTGTTAVEHGDGYNHVTVLTMAGTLPDIAGGGAEAEGLLIYTFPAGVTRVKSVHMDVGITQSEGNINADTPKVGIGSVIGAGAVSVLNGTTGFDDYVVEQTAANCTGTTTDKSEDTAVAGLKLNEAGGVKAVHFNCADSWASSGDAAATLSGTVTIEWTFLGT